MKKYEAEYKELCAATESRVGLKQQTLLDSFTISAPLLSAQNLVLQVSTALPQDTAPVAFVGVFLSRHWSRNREKARLSRGASLRS